MSTLKSDVVEAATTDGVLTLRGNGTGTVAISDNTAITGTFTASGIQTLAAAIAGADNQVGRVNLIDYGEVTNAIGSNPPASDELCGFTLFLTNGGAQTVNWPASVDWAGGTAPTLTTSGLDILVFTTTDGGTIWHGMVSSADSKTPS